MYQEYIQAAYVGLGGERGQWRCQGGLRLRHTNTHGLQDSTGEEFRCSYPNGFPRATLAGGFG